MNKFKSPEDYEYKSVSYQIDKMAEGIAKIELGKKTPASYRLENYGGGRRYLPWNE